MVHFMARHPESGQILIFAATVSILWVIEQIALTEPSGPKVRHAAVNVLFVLTALPAELVLSAICLSVSTWVDTMKWGLLNQLPDASNPWIRYVLAFVALDFCDYAYHRVAHRIPVIWRFHLVHHTDRTVDVSTTMREHPGETVARGAFLVLSTFVLGASFEVLLLRQAAETIFAIFSHTATRLPPRLGHLLGLVFITPNLHHVHHHFERPYTDKNFGGVFSVWDRLFGTFAEPPAIAMTFGLDTHMEPVAVGDPRRLFAMPFAPSAPLSPASPPEPAVFAPLCP
jgi:sterol desaturase/sphingolipid hydroxylase (fatty acid hydroxylase superfamily)